MCTLDSGETGSNCAKVRARLWMSRRRGSDELPSLGQTASVKDVKLKSRSLSRGATTRRDARTGLFHASN